MNTSNLTKAQRKRAKRAQRRYTRLDKLVPQVCPTDSIMIERHWSRVRRLQRFAYKGWNHLNAAIIASLNGDHS